MNLTGQATAELIRDFRRSAWEQLGSGGEVHIVVTQSLLEKYSEVVSALSQWTEVPRFADSAYFAPYSPRYTTGDEFWKLGEWRTKVGRLWDYIFRKGG